MNFQEAKELALKFPGSTIKSSGNASFTVIAKDGKVIDLTSIDPPDTPLPPTEEESIIELVVTIEDSQKVESQEDCDDFIKAISELILNISDKVMLGNGKRRILELKLIRPTLPNKEGMQLIQGLKYLNSHPPKCLCNSLMQLREVAKKDSKNKGDYFWGCLNFSLPYNDPKKCVRTKQLSKEERSRITPPYKPLLTSKHNQP